MKSTAYETKVYRTSVLLNFGVPEHIWNYPDPTAESMQSLLMCVLRSAQKPKEDTLNINDDVFVYIIV